MLGPAREAVGSFSWPMDATWCSQQAPYGRSSGGYISCLSYWISWLPLVSSYTIEDRWHWTLIIVLEKPISISINDCQQATEQPRLCPQRFTVSILQRRKLSPTQACLSKVKRKGWGWNFIVNSMLCRPTAGWNVLQDFSLILRAKITLRRPELQSFAERT